MTAVWPVSQVTSPTPDVMAHPEEALLSRRGRGGSITAQQDRCRCCCITRQASDSWTPLNCILNCSQPEITHCVWFIWSSVSRQIQQNEQSVYKRLNICSQRSWLWVWTSGGNISVFWLGQRTRVYLYVLYFSLGDQLIGNHAYINAILSYRLLTVAYVTQAPQLFIISTFF